MNNVRAYLEIYSEAGGEPSIIWNSHITFYQSGLPTRLQIIKSIDELYQRLWRDSNNANIMRYVSGKKILTCDHEAGIHEFTFSFMPVERMHIATEYPVLRITHPNAGPIMEYDFSHEDPEIDSYTMTDVGFYMATRKRLAELFDTAQSMIDIDCLALSGVRFNRHNELAYDMIYANSVTASEAGPLQVPIPEAPPADTGEALVIPY